MNTLIITGAGSNISYGFMTGASLRERIINHTESLWQKYTEGAQVNIDDYRWVKCPQAKVQAISTQFTEHSVTH